MATEEGQTTSNYVSYGDTSGSSNMCTYYHPSRGVYCPYVGKCSDYMKRCDSCRHNTAKGSYYEPEDYPYYPEPRYPYYPYYPNYPNYPWYPTITWEGTNPTTSDSAGDDITCYATS